MICATFLLSAQTTEGTVNRGKKNKKVGLYKHIYTIHKHTHTYRLLCLFLSLSVVFFLNLLITTKR